jgi:hypothetical protein
MSALPQSSATTREILVLAEDPSVLSANGKPLLTKVKIPAEVLLPGPRGARIEVIDYDASTGHFYKPIDLNDGHDLFKKAPSVDQVQSDPRFHAQNVFGIAAATLLQFEQALGRNLSWGFSGRSHQLKIVPHAFREANAFYSREDEALLFGYFGDERDTEKTVFTCLSHDIVAHETTHALLDGLREQLMRPSHPQQAAFHEGFSDIVALLSVLRSEHIISYALTKEKLAKSPQQRVSIDKVMEALASRSILSGLAKQVGEATDSLNRNALRRSVEIEPSKTLLDSTEEPHDLGEILVAIIMQAYYKVWHARLTGKFKAATSTQGKAKAPRLVEAWRVAEEGAKAAQHLLTMVIRAIDYLPTVHLKFEDVLMAVITSDWQTCQDDSSYHYRHHLRAAFAEFGIKVSDKSNTGEMASYRIFDLPLRYNHGNSDSLRWDRDGMFKFIWNNRAALELVDHAYTRVSSVRSVWRVAPDGQILRETVAEFYQLLKQADRSILKQLKIPVPDFVDAKTRFDLVGGGTLVFDEFGTLKFYVSNHINSKKQSGRLQYLQRANELTLEAAPSRPFALAHRRRSGFRNQTPPWGARL